MRSRVPIHQGQGPGLSSYTIGQIAGVEATTLTTAQMPAHNHAFASPCNTDDPSAGSPKNNFPAAVGDPIYATTSNAAMGAGTTGATGGSQPFPIVQPYLTVNFCIALQGIFPSRN